MIKPMSVHTRFLPALLVLSVLALGLALLFGCGGGGGGGSSTSSGPITTGYTQYGVTAATPPTLSPGDQVTLTASVTIGGVTSALTPYNFVVQGGSTNGTVTTAGLLTAGSGIAAGTIYTVTANTNDGPASWTFTGGAPLTQPVIIGIVEASATSGAVAGATITAFDAHGNTVGTATSGANGIFSMPVTDTATQFGVTIGGVNTTLMTFYPQFGYGSAQYATTSPQCLPALPGFTLGNAHYALAYPIVLDTDVYNDSTYPPAPPPGCFP